MGPPTRNSLPIYTFGEFTLDVAERRLLDSGAVVDLEPKALEMLVVLVGQAGSLVTRRELLDILWPDTFVEEGNLNSYLSVLRKALGDSKKLSRFIETVPKAGYRFVADVEKISRQNGNVPSATTEPDPVDEIPEVVPVEPAPPPESRWWHYGAHVLVSSALYALLFVVALFVEVAYSYESFGQIGWSLAPWIFGWIMTTSAIGLWVDVVATRSGRVYGLLVSVLVFLVAGFGLVTAVSLWLPPHSITKASLQTYTAQAAYVKNAFYFVPLAILYVVLPLNLVARLEGELRRGRTRPVLRLLSGGRPKPAPRGSVYLRVWWLTVLLVVVAVTSAYGTAHLFDRLTPDANANLFMRLYQIRLFLFFLLASASVGWLQLSFDRLRRQSRAALNADNGLW